MLPTYGLRKPTHFLLRPLLSVLQLDRGDAHQCQHVSTMFGWCHRSWGSGQKTGRVPPVWVVWLLVLVPSQCHFGFSLLRRVSLHAIRTGSAQWLCLVPQPGMAMQWTAFGWMAMRHSRCRGELTLLRVVFCQWRCTQRDDWQPSPPPNLRTILLQISDQVPAPILQPVHVGVLHLCVPHGRVAAVMLHIENVQKNSGGGSAGMHAMRVSHTPPPPPFRRPWFYAPFSVDFFAVHSGTNSYRDGPNSDQRGPQSLCMFVCLYEFVLA